MMVKIYFNPAIHKVIAKKGIEKGELAKDLSITAQHLSRLLHQKSSVGTKTRRRIVTIFNGFAWDKLFTTGDE